MTEFLITSGMRPQQLAAAGYSQYDPVNKARKQENRRIEIVLQPSIDELPQFPEDLAAATDGKADGKGDAKADGKTETPAAKKTP